MGAERTHVYEKKELMFPELEIRTGGIRLSGPSGRQVLEQGVAEGEGKHGLSHRHAANGNTGVVSALGADCPGLQLRV